MIHLYFCTNDFHTFSVSTYGIRTHNFRTSDHSVTVLEFARPWAKLMLGLIIYINKIF
jgi:hypothetical protein